jgi:hypothetical protein
VIMMRSSLAICAMSAVLASLKLYGFFPAPSVCFVLSQCTLRCIAYNGSSLCLHYQPIMSWTCNGFTLYNLLLLPRHCWCCSCTTQWQ